MNNFITGTHELTRATLKENLFQHLKSLNLEQALFPSNINEPINKLIKQLELLNPTPEPLHPQAFPLLLGNWQLIYASEGTVITRQLASTPNPLLKTINLKQIWQHLSAGEKRNLLIKNGATIELPIFGTWQLIAEGKWKWQQDNQPAATVTFDNISIHPIIPQNWKLPVLKIPILDLIKKEALWNTTYLDTEIRINQGKTGNLFLFHRPPNH